MDKLKFYLKRNNPFKKTITDLQVTVTSTGKGYWLTYIKFNLLFKYVRTVYGEAKHTDKTITWYNEDGLVTTLPGFDKESSGNHYNLLLTLP